MNGRLLLSMLVLVLAGCFGNAPQQRRYYTLYVTTAPGESELSIPGSAYVRDLNAESAYDKFQIVVRTSPFELAYRESQVWAVRPNRMVSDLLARTLLDKGVFASVTRELGSRRPDYIFGGDLHAIEIYDSDDEWFAHLALSLNATAFDTGEIIWSFNFDERKPVFVRDFSTATRALSELLSAAMDDGIRALVEAQRARLGQKGQGGDVAPAERQASDAPAAKRQASDGSPAIKKAGEARAETGAIEQAQPKAPAVILVPEPKP